MEELSYLNDPTIKEKYLLRVTEHEKADEIVQGKYWENGKGCAVGCTLHSNASDSIHKKFEKKLGIPEWCARLEDRIFEGLSDEEAKSFPRQFLEAVPVGKNNDWWNKIKWSFTAFILRENIERVLSLGISEELKKQVVDAVRQCLALQENALEKGVFDDSAWSAAAAESAAESAARSAAWSAWSARSAARSAAESAAWSAAWSARSAAWSAAESAAWSARSARSAAAWSAAAARSAYGRYRDEVLTLLREVN